MLRALDHLPHGLVVLDARGRVLLANRRASAILAARDGLRMEEGELHAARPAADTALQKLICDANWQNCSYDVYRYFYFELTAVSATSQGAGVPAPATLVLLGAGLAGLGILARRRARAPSGSGPA